MENGEIDSILQSAIKDTGYTKAGGFTIPLKKIEKIQLAVKDHDISLTIEAFGNLIGKDITKTKTPINTFVNAFNNVMKKHYGEIPLKASGRKNTVYVVEEMVDGKKQKVEKTGMIAIVKTDRS